MARIGRDGVPGQFGPVDVAIDSAGNIWATDFNNQSVDEFDSNGNFLATVRRLWSRELATLISSGHRVCQVGRYFDLQYLGDCIDEFSGGVLLRSFGTAGSGNGQLNSPCGMAVDSAGDIWVADTGNDRIEEFDSSGNYLA